MNRLVMAIASASIAAAGAAALAAARSPAPGALGLETANFDRSVRPQDDLFRFVNGEWLRKTAIPPDRSNYGSFTALDDKAQADLRALIEEAAAVANAPQGSDAQKVGDFYRSFMDSARADSLAVQPLQPQFKRIDALADKQALLQFLGEAQYLGFSQPIGLYIAQDEKNTTAYIPIVVQSGITLPDRDYYLKDDAKSAALRDKYVAYIAQLVQLAGLGDGPDSARRIMAFETRLAAAQWTRVQNRDAVATYNKHTLASANALTPGLDWQRFFHAAGIDTPDLVITQPSYFTALGRALDEVPVADWRLYLKFKLLNDYAPYLSAAFVAAHFDLHGRTIKGIEENRPRWKRAVEAVEQGKTKFVPEEWTKTYMHWMTNIRDWCISRQLWWGHRIPAWYCGACQHITVARQDPAACERCGGAELRQDEDILDTWFSSALWPFSTLGWPDKTRALATYYPNAVLATAPDIIFFWVARMMMMGLHFMGKVPFRTVYLTAIVTDENGDKMSKVKGNVIDPLDVVFGATLEAMLARADAENAPEVAIKGIKKNFAKGVPAMGADALRFSLAALNTSGRYLRLSLDRVEGYRHFINKLWNASRFALMNMDGYDAERFESQRANQSSWTLADRWILSRLQRVAAEVDVALEAFRFSDAANALYQFVWHQLCDWYIELAKPYLLQGEPADAARSARRHIVQGVLATVLEHTMRLLHPFAPFVTEEIWQKLPKPAQLPESLMVTVYPRGDERVADVAAERDMAQLQ
ncbi:MAG: class I tRNA ligase family protein, partial [Gammaproteobacteria bacterium]|nr:class I tRNA ligase family protein [Gammaproteobacteria bacterium]